MKFHFEPNLDYQLEAIQAVSDLFRGQEICHSDFTVIQRAVNDQGQFEYSSKEKGYGNRLLLKDDELLKNLHDVQLRNAVPPSMSLESRDFTVEMETGTGKTYVYLRTIFELNKQYGFTKFVIVVPSVAIKEGVNKSIASMEEHFRALYSGVPFNYFIYDSSKPGQVRNFATSSSVQIMVVTVGAINKKDVNNLYKESEKTGGDKPIDLISATNPILIVDEPQSVDGGLSGKGKEALDLMCPLCTLRYSATHVNKFNMVYRLDAVDAYDRKLVKQIEVAAATVESAHNRPYVRVISLSNKRNQITATLELDGSTKTGGVETKSFVVQSGDPLDHTTCRAVYHDCQIGEIDVGRGFVELKHPGGQEFLKVGDVFGGVDALAMQREMIRRTIKEHFEKELRLAPRGIKVLSLFFIDHVEKYRKYDKDGHSIKSDYARIFEEEYTRLAKHPAYQSLFREVDVATAAAEVHDGYFSIDKKGGWTDTSESNQTSRENAERAYNLIMKEKEKLLSFETPLKFIFSHSALKEGWDNPNVFQICTLRDMSTERERRQTIGRGLRLCVNQDGDRVRGFETNTLTVIATESYEQFAERLQTEIEQDTGIRFGMVEKHQFAGVIVGNDGGKRIPLGFEQSNVLWDYLKTEGYINAQGKVQDKLRAALKDGTLTLPESFKAQTSQIREILRKLSGKLDIKNADERKTIPTRQAILDSEAFKALWDRIKHKTTYRVQFDGKALIETCVADLKQFLEDNPIPRSVLQWHKADIQITRAGVEAEQRSESIGVAIDEGDIDLPDVLSDLQDKTQLTRKSLYSIIAGSGHLNDFRRNPQAFIEVAANRINHTKRKMLVDGIMYQKIGNDVYYAQELFRNEELQGYLQSSVESTKSPYERVIYQSDTEHSFAEQLERNEAIKVYAKLPSWFKVPTPLGFYNPDWAVLVEKDGVERLYFVVETKSSLFVEDLREKEEKKIQCAKAHFEELARGVVTPVSYIKATRLEDVLIKC